LGNFLQIKKKHNFGALQSSSTSSFLPSSSATISRIFRRKKFRRKLVCGAVADLAPDLQFYVQMNLLVFGKGRLPAFNSLSPNARFVPVDLLQP